MTTTPAPPPPQPDAAPAAGDWFLRPLSPADWPQVAAIFNHYVRHTSAAFFEQELPATVLGKLLESSRGLPSLAVAAREDSARVGGFGLLRPYHASPVFARSAELTCFLDPALTRQGLGSRLLAALGQAARQRGVDHMLATVAADNQASLAFHRYQGFSEVGRLPQVGRKHGQDLSLVLLLREL
ncbi:MAG: GNAT family N-acetyltransferase [Deltaproteobacteria bacterium]|nr:GNAT family N-acetyltransferase [Deltaproteobacteria bacterium]